MQDSFARARTRPKGLKALGLKAKRARDDRVSCIQIYSVRRKLILTLN